MKLFNMPLQKNCATTSNHAELAVSENLEFKSVGSEFERKLLELAVAHIKTIFFYKFCVGFIKHVTELRPDTGSDESHSPYQKNCHIP